MFNSVGNACYSTAGATVSSAVSALNGRIRNDKLQLDDWVTCVSAKTVKGQAEIQRLSSQVSADHEQLSRVEALQTSAAGKTSAAAKQSAAARYAPGGQLSGMLGNSLDVWA